MLQGVDTAHYYCMSFEFVTFRAIYESSSAALFIGRIFLKITMATGLSRSKGGRGVTLTTHPHLVPRSWKSRVIPLLPLWGRVA
jgi:hypothetical protein